MHVLMQDEEPIRDSSSDINYRVRTFDGSQKMMISAAEVEDTGRYACLALSIAGQASKNIELNVYGKFHWNFFETFGLESTKLVHLFTP